MNAVAPHVEPSCADCRQRNRTIAHLQERIHLLENIGGDPLHRFKFGLTKKQWVLFSFLFNTHGYASLDRLGSLYEFAGSATPTYTIRVHIANMRPALKCFGIEINTIRGEGYEISMQDKQKIAAIIEQTRGP